MAICSIVLLQFMASTVVIRTNGELYCLQDSSFILYRDLLLTFQNQAKRKIGYEVNLGNRGSKWYSRSMGLLGTILFIISCFFIGGISGYHQDLHMQVLEEPNPVIEWLYRA